MRLGGVSLALLVALASAASCDAADAPGIEPAAHDAWTLYLDRPGADTYDNFIRVNRMAADRHGNPHDGTGVEYQVRALETMAAEAVRAKDAALADDVVTRIDEIERMELKATYDEVRPGAGARIDAARAQAASLLR